MRDFMLDLETVNTTPDAAIVSIGCIRFNILTGTPMERFESAVGLKSCLDIGLTVSADTFYWWLSPDMPQAARDAVRTNPVSIDEATDRFSNWIYEFKTDLRRARLWGNGSGFDNVILRNAYRKLGKPFPFGYGRDRDVRTMVEVALLINQNFSRGERTGTHHNAIDDALYQIEYVSRAWRMINAR